MEKVDKITKNHSLAVGIGTKVFLEVNGEPQVWEIVNVGEADVAKGKISREAPLVKCILGAKEGEMVKCEIMDKEITVIIKEILRLLR